MIRLGFTRVGAVVYRRGGTIVEYALLLALLGGLCVGGVKLGGIRVQRTWGEVRAAVDRSPREPGSAHRPSLSSLGGRGYTGGGKGGLGAGKGGQPQPEEEEQKEEEEQ